MPRVPRQRSFRLGFRPYEVPFPRVDDCRSIMRIGFVGAFFNRLSSEVRRKIEWVRNVSPVVLEVEAVGHAKAGIGLREVGIELDRTPQNRDDVIENLTILV